MATKPATTVLKAFELLELFQYRASLSVGQCASLLGIPRATAHRLLVTLEAAGVVERSDEGHYRLGLRMFELGALAPLRRLYSEQSRLPLQRLSAQTGLPVHLAVREESTGILLEVIPGTRYDMPTRVGFPIPLHSTALGKLLLAYASREVYDRVVEGGLPAFTRHTIRRSDDLARELEAIKAAGVSYDREETHEGFTCVAVPIRLHGYEIRSAVSMSYPADSTADAGKHYLNTLTVARNKVEDAVNAHMRTKLSVLRGVPSRRPSARPAVDHLVATGSAVG